MIDRSISKFLPLTEATYYILLALTSPKHGYAVMQEAEELSDGTISLAPGTIYGAFTTLETGKLIFMVGTEGRRKIYQITEKGTRVLLEQVRRLRIMLQNTENKKIGLKTKTSKEGEL
ncbi:MAG: PadR family transcriptional regulator [Chloroflexi bacterium]|nr:PadR family transcriptional regulator [Chloroflexota bacterium]